MIRRPNILWICSDQQRCDTLGCYGNQFVKTPNLDRLAETGVLFEHCFTQSPVCTPSRASFLTGRYPRTIRCRQNGQALPNDEVPITRLLADAGFNCGLSGKLHLSPVNPQVCWTTERRIDDGYAEFHWSPQPDPYWPNNEYVHWLRERNIQFKRSSFGASRYVEVGLPAQHHQTTWCAQKATNFIEANATFDQPWLFSANFFDPHHPFDPPADYLERYLDRLDDIPLPNFTPGELSSKPIFQQVDHHGAYSRPGGYFSAAGMNDTDHRLIRAAYWAMVDLIDEQVGRIIVALESTDQLDNTIVIFMSDHGEMLGDHGIYLKGPYLYDPAVRVPLIISWPSVLLGNRRSKALIELVDLMPTLLDAVGLAHHPGIQGKSVWPMLTNQTDLLHHRDDVYCESYNALSHKDPKAYATMVRTDRHKLIALHGISTGELYDLREDPTETNNRWDDTEYLPVKSAMLERLCDRMAWTVDPLPVRQSNW